MDKAMVSEMNEKSAVLSLRTKIDVLTVLICLVPYEPVTYVL